jgi:nucleoside-diphosphate-sugar epimerase
VGANRSRGDVFDESAPYDPYMGYGRSKMGVELEVAKLRKAGALETVIVRAPWFYGPGQPPRQTLFFELIRDGRLPIVGDGSNRRSMVYIDNLCQGLQLAALCPAADGELYWIADERPYTVNEIVDTVEQLLEGEFGLRCRHRRLRVPALVGDLAWLADAAVQGLGGYCAKIHVLSEMGHDIACSVDRARRDLGYRPAVALDEGMRRSIQWCVERGILGPRSARRRRKEQPAPS